MRNESDHKAKTIEQQARLRESSVAYLFSGLQQFWKVTSDVESNLTRYWSAFAHVAKNLIHITKYCDDTAHHQWAKRWKREARSNDIAAARPKALKEISAVFA